MSTFDECLKYAESKIWIAENFYNIFHGPHLKKIRWFWNDPAGRRMQQKDIDISIEQPGFKNGYINISEKFRSMDYGDMFIELYSKWSDTEFNSIPGWGLEGESDFIYYYVPGKLYAIDNERLKYIVKRIHQRIFGPNFYHNLRGELKELDSYDLEVNITINNKEYNIPIQLRKIKTNAGENTYQGLGMIIEWKYLRKLVNIYKYGIDE